MPIHSPSASSPTNGHHRSPSSASSSGEPTQTHHHSLLPTVPTPALVESVAGAAHYSGSNVEPLKHRHSSHDRTESHEANQKRVDAVLADVRELFECRPTPEIFARSWHKDAVFEDPLAHARGFREYAAQWYAMPSLFSKSDTLSSRVMSATRVPNRIVFSQSQRYQNRFMNKVRCPPTADLNNNCCPPDS